MSRRLVDMAPGFSPPDQATWDRLMLYVGTHASRLLGDLTDQRWRRSDTAVQRVQELRLGLILDAAWTRTPHHDEPLAYYRRLAQTYRSQFPEVAQARTAFLRDLASDRELSDRLNWDSHLFRDLWDRMLPGYPPSELEELRTIVNDRWVQRAPLLHKMVTQELTLHLARSWTYRPAAQDREIAQQLFDWWPQLPEERRIDLVQQVRGDAPRVVQCLMALMGVITGRDHRQTFRERLQVFVVSRIATAQHRPELLLEMAGNAQFLAALERAGISAEVTLLRQAAARYRGFNG